MKYIIYITLFISIGCSSKQEYYETEFDDEDLDTLLCDVDKTECKPIKKSPKR